MADERDVDLLCDVKNYLDITWDDPLGEKKLMGMIKRGMAAISGKIGECDFYGDWLWDTLDLETGVIDDGADENQERALLFDYVMYARAGEIKQFWENYRQEIISLQISRKVDAYAESQEPV